MASHISTPADHVFSVAELVEHILLHVDDMRSLLSLSRVSRLCNATIAYNITLRQRLFLKPLIRSRRKTTDCRPVLRVRSIHSRQNPLLRQCFRPWFDLFGSSHPSSFQPVEGRLPGHWGKEAFAATKWGSKDTATAATYRHRVASWRQMLVAQPPVKFLRIVREELDKHLRKVRVFEVVLKCAATDGLRMGMLYDVTQQFLIQNRNGAWRYRDNMTFRVDWHLAEGARNCVVLRLWSHGFPVMNDLEDGGKFVSEGFQILEGLPVPRVD